MNNFPAPTEPSINNITVMYVVKYCIVTNF